MRSNYVMWCGNVAQDATLDELWAFFTSIPKDDTLISPSGDTLSTPAISRTGPAEEEPRGIADNHAGILSIFIISRSSCTFVNYATEAALLRACAYFNGRQLRPKPTYPKLVCRPRKQEDAEYAGVAAQRGKGVHVAWFKQQKQLEQQRRIEQMLINASLHDEGRLSTDDNTFEDWHTNSSSSGDSRSYASTNSSLLRQPEFRSRFFILKSSTREALDTALETGTWATQPHNESVLNQAFRNSQTVYLLFSENLSGQLFGCAVMTSPIGSPGMQQSPPAPHFDEPHRELVAEPYPLPDTQEGAQDDEESSSEDRASGSRDDQTAQQKSPPSFTSTTPSVATENEMHDQLATTAIIHNFRLELRAEEADKEKASRESSKTDSAQPAPSAQHPSAFGHTFNIRWIITQPLPFSKIQHLRNPWRDNRLVKVSRDGTELEPHVGAELLKVWESYCG